MEVTFDDPDLDRMEIDANETCGLSEGVVRSFRKKMQVIRAVKNENDLRAMGSLHFEVLKGKRAHQASIRLNNKYRLILEIEERSGSNNNVLHVKGIEDYHR